MEDAAILSAIFSDVEEEEEQDNGDNFVSDTIGKEDTMHHLALDPVTRSNA